MMENSTLRPLTLLLAATALVVGIVGCDTFETLDTQPENSVPADQALIDAQGANSTLLGLYDETQGFLDDYTIFSALAADQADHTGSFPSWAAVDDHTLASTSPEAEGQWNGLYDAINVANLLVEKVRTDSLENLGENEAASIRAQARTIRAFSYHGLIRWFGDQDDLVDEGESGDDGVPIILEPTENIDDITFPTRSSVGEVYQQILDDLSTAESLLEENPEAPNEAGFVDALTIDALQARVYLYRASLKRRAGESAQGDYQAARDNAQAVLSQNDNLSRLDAIYGAQNSGESLWEIQYSSTDGNAMSFFARPNGEGGREEYNLENDRQDEFVSDSLDNRLGVNVKTAGGTDFIGKYFRIDGSDHHYILRVSEVKLILAEALAFLDFEGNQSAIIEQVNDIRERSYNEFNEGDPQPDFQEADAELEPGDVQTQQDAIDLILAERKDELAFEGHRWHDLNRLGRVQEVENLQDPERDLRWPIPQEELDVNDNLKQNPNY